jgi:hypothetical protein
MKNCCFIGTFLLMMAFFSCKNEKDTVVPDDGYDVFLVIGQSNTHQGLGYNLLLDYPDDKIKQLGRFGESNLQIIKAAEPLDHFSKYPNTIGFAMTFAKEYKKKYLLSGRTILLIPGALGGTGFWSNHWKVGDTLYNDAVMRTNLVLNKFNCKLAAILWHQGESDIGNSNYQQNLDSMIVNFRKDVAGGNQIPFILGGMVPYWVQQDTSRIIQNRIIENTVNRIQNTGYANPEVPFLIAKTDKNFDPIHYDAIGQRELGRRYFAEFERIWGLYHYK